jgi:hypothetical protein
MSFERNSSLRLKNLLFGFIGVMLLYVLGHNERFFLIEAKDPEWPQPHQWRETSETRGGILYQRMVDLEGL